MGIYPNIPAKLLHNHDIVSEHFNQFPYMGIYDTQSGCFSILIYIYRNV